MKNEMPNLIPSAKGLPCARRPEARPPRVAVALALWITLLSPGCGRDAAISNQLPNRMVPNEVTAEESVRIDNRTSRSATTAKAITTGTTNTTNAASPKTTDRAVVKTKATSPQAVTRQATKKVSPQAMEQTATSLHLGAVAAALASLPQAEYDAKQKRWIGNTAGACNYFLITALCEAGYCQNGKKPMYRAADFDRYFKQTGWKILTLDQLRAKAKAGEAMDVVFQKPGPTADRSGHVMVYVGYDAGEDLVTVAQGDLGRITHELTDLPAESLLTWEGGYTIFVKQ